MKTGIETLLLEVRSLILSARKVASRNINTIQVITNFRIGLLIVEHEQKGKERADYGKKVLSELSKRLTVEFGRGFSQSNLEYMRKFYLMYREEKNRISQTVFGKSLMKTESSVADQSKIQLSLPEMDNIFTLSWSHYLFLMNIKDTKERSAAKDGLFDTGAAKDIRTTFRMVLKSVASKNTVNLLSAML